MVIRWGKGAETYSIDASVVKIEGTTVELSSLSRTLEEVLRSGDGLAFSPQVSDDTGRGLSVMFVRTDAKPGLESLRQ